MLEKYYNNTMHVFNKMKIDFSSWCPSHHLPFCVPLRFQQDNITFWNKNTNKQSKT